MKAYITSIGESTTEICKWSLERYGYEVELVENQGSLWSKLKYIYNTADNDFVRVDADVVVGQNILELTKQSDAWWYQSMIYEWFRQDVGHGGIQFIRKECLPALREHVDEAERLERPESYMSRLKEFHDPRRFESFSKVCGIHGFKQSDVQRVKDTKMRRGQYGNYDWELAEKLDAL